LAERAERPDSGIIAARLGRFALVAAIVSLTAAILYGAGAFILRGGKFGETADRLPATNATPVSSVLLVPTSATVTPATPVPTVEPTPIATPSPPPSPAIVASRYRLGGRNYVGLEVPVDASMAARFDGTVEIRTYQFIEGEVRLGSNVPALPFFPYVAVVGDDRRIVYRPGALGRDTEPLVRDGERVETGQALFRIIGPGRSSWATFYDSRVPFQVVVSLQALPSGRELDALAYFAEQ
jgi:hypothetical protein